MGMAAMKNQYVAVAPREGRVSRNDCKLPDDGQRILVNVSVRGHESVQYDEFYTDDGSYLDSGYEIGTEATAWMPLPGPYKEATT